MFLFALYWVGHSLHLDLHLLNHMDRRHLLKMLGQSQSLDLSQSLDQPMLYHHLHQTNIKFFLGLLSRLIVQRFVLSVWKHTKKANL
jgi:hypothetical protein